MLKKNHTTCGHTLDLGGTNITDASVKELKNCHTTGLRACGMQSIPHTLRPVV